MFTTKIYASPANFTPLLEVMEVTFRRSGVAWAMACGIDFEETTSLADPLALPGAALQTQS